MGYTPLELLIGHTPLINMTKTLDQLPHITQRAKMLGDLRDKARSAMKHAQTLLAKRSEQKKGRRHYRGYLEGEKVWLEGTNLKITHGSSKLAPKQYGPFTITKVISPVVV